MSSTTVANSYPKRTLRSELREQLRRLEEEKQWRPSNFQRRFVRLICLWAAIHDNVDAKMIDSINLTTHNIMSSTAYCGVAEK